MLFTYADKEFTELILKGDELEEFERITGLGEVEGKDLIASQLDGRFGHVEFARPIEPDLKRRLVASEILEVVGRGKRARIGIVLVLDYLERGQMWVRGVRQIS
jgi:hypothetical protein